MGIRVASSDREINPARIIAMDDNQGGGFLLGPIRASFVFIKKGKLEKQTQRMKYQLVGLIPPGTDIMPLWRAAEDLIRENNKKIKPTDQIPAAIRRGIRFVDKEPNYQGKDGFEPGWAFMSFVTYETPPGVVDAQRNPIDPGAVVSGYWVRVRSKPFYYNTDGGMGVSWGLNAVQLGYSDRRLDARIDAEQAFDAWEVDGTDATSGGPGEVNPWD